MGSKQWVKIVFIFALAGLIFSGYLSAVKLFSNTCAFDEPCPYFLGYPACWYGFGMYLIIFIATALALLGKADIKSVIKTSAAVSFLGILFAGRFFIQELLQSKITGALGLSTCTYGLIFYILIFVLSLGALKKSKI